MILIEKPNVALERGLKKDDEDGLMVPLDLPCCIFDENEKEEFHHFFDIVDAFAKPKSHESLSKYNADKYNEFKLYLNRIKILNKEVSCHNEFYIMFMKDFHQKDNDNQTLKKEMDEMRVREADLVK